MKQLFLIRHAKSSWDDSDCADFDRPLNRRGRENAPRMGMRLQERAPRPDLIVSSPARRAKDTAQLIAAEVAYPGEEILLADELYLAGVRTLLDIIRGFDNRRDRIFLIGHNPGLTDLANLLTGDTLANLPTCAVYVVEFPFPDWSQAERESGTCLWLSRPKDA